MSIRSITIVGPFATEYSLARVNRALARALSEANPQIKVRLWANEEFCDRLPGKVEFTAYPYIKDLYDSEPGDPDLVIFNNFPKNPSSLYGLKALPGRIKIGYLAWEETVFPKRWVEEINSNLHGMLVTSSHVKKVFIISGVRIPIQVVPLGLDIPFAESQKLAIPTRKNYKLLHISSGHYRKGVDILLKAYLKEFSAKDDIALVLKLFPNASTSREIDKILAERTSASAEVLQIRDNNLSDGQLRYLYEACNALVMPSRAEGFGLPMAEALQLRRNLVTTDFSGHTDFCIDDNCLLLDYKLVDSKSDLNIPGAKVAEPDEDMLRYKLRMLYDHRQDPEFFEEMLHQGVQMANELRWSTSAKQTMEFVTKIAQLVPLKTKRLAVVSTWNSRCGVAEYSRALYGPVAASFQNFKVFSNSDIGDRTASDEDFVERDWQYGEMDFKALEKDLQNFKPDILHFQYNLSFYSPLLMAELAAKFTKAGVKTLITLHSVHPSIEAAVSQLRNVTAVLVHSQQDKAFLEKSGLNNVAIVDHGLPDFKYESQHILRDRLGLEKGLDFLPVIATHGMIHDKKGLLELIQAVDIVRKQIPDILLLAHSTVNPNNGTSAAIYEQCQKYITEHKLEQNIILINEFLPIPEVIRILQLSDLIVLPYADINEGASGAVRICMAAKRPVIITNSYIFSNLDAGYRIKNNQPATIAEAIEKLMQDNMLRGSVATDILKYTEKHLWDGVAMNYLHKLVTGFKG